MIIFYLKKKENIKLSKKNLCKLVFEKVRFQITQEILFIILILESLLRFFEVGWGGGYAVIGRRYKLQNFKLLIFVGKEVIVYKAVFIFYQELKSKNEV